VLAASPTLPEPTVRPLPLLVVVLLVLLLTGCRLAVVTEVAVDRDGTVSAGVLLRLDPRALAALDDLGVDPTAELAAVARDVPTWQVTRTTEDDGSLAVRLVHEPTDAVTAADALRELAAGLAPEDPALLLDLDLAVDADGAARLTGDGGFRPPATPGGTLDGEPLGPDEDELARLTAEMLEVRLVVTFPGAVVDHDADGIEGRTATWELPVGTEPRAVQATAAAPGGLPSWALPVAGAVLAALAIALVPLVLRRRRRGGRSVSRAG
jgi:hypothetical protein